MTIRSTTLTDELYDYLLRVGVREPLVMAWLRAENERLPENIRDRGPERADHPRELADLRVRRLWPITAAQPTGP